MWYKIALRKNVMRADLHVHPGEAEDFNTPNAMDNAIKSMLTSAISKGLDIIGIVSYNGPQIGNRAQQIAQDNHLDLYVAAGEEYTTSDKFKFVIFNLKQPVQPNLTSDQAIKFAHQNNGFVLAISLTRRQMQHLRKIKGAPEAPDAVEIYNASLGAYHDTNIDYPKFVSSGAKSTTQLDNVNVFTLIDRKDLEAMNVLPIGFGAEYTPRYLGGTPEQQAPSEQQTHPVPAPGVPQQ